MRSGGLATSAVPEQLADPQQSSQLNEWLRAQQQTRNENQKSASEARETNLRDAERQLNQAREEVQQGLRDLDATYATKCGELNGQQSKIDSDAEQLGFRKQSVDELVFQAQNKDATAAELRQQYICDVWRWWYLSKRDICEKVTAANEESLFLCMKAMGDLARATWGGGGTTPSVNGRNAVTYAGEQPRDTAAREWENAAKTTWGEAKKAGIDYQSAVKQVEAERAQLKSHRQDLAQEHANQQESLTAKYQRLTKQLNEIRDLIKNVIRGMDESAKEFTNGQEKESGDATSAAPPQTPQKPAAPRRRLRKKKNDTPSETGPTPPPDTRLSGEEAKRANERLGELEKILSVKFDQKTFDGAKIKEIATMSDARWRKFKKDAKEGKDPWRPEITPEEWSRAEQRYIEKHQNEYPQDVLRKKLEQLIPEEIIELAYREPND